MKTIIYLPPPKASRIKCYIPYAAGELRAAVKKMNTSYYHPTQKLWSVVNTPENLEALKIALGPDVKLEEAQGTTTPVPTKKLSLECETALAAFEQCILLKGYSRNTLKNYRNELIQFFNYFDERDFKSIRKEEIESFVAMLISKHGITDAKQNQMINAIKFYYEQVLGQPREFYDIQRPKRARELPNVLSQSAVIKLINSPENIKHKAMLYLIYSAGLRSGELLNLRIRDIQSDQGFIFIKGGKGKKDRRTVLSEKLLLLLRDYYKLHKPAYWLFEGQQGGQYTARSLQAVFRRAVEMTNINPWATLEIKHCA